MFLLEDQQLAAFTPRLDAQFRAHCIDALRARGDWPQERLERAVDTALARARELGLFQERAVLAYLLLAVDILLARPAEELVRAVESILREPALSEWERAHFAADYFRQMRDAKA